MANGVRVLNRYVGHDGGVCPFQEGVCMLRIIPVSPQEAPMDLLLEADPSERHVKAYLNGSLCYLAMKSDEPLGVCVLKEIGDSVLELYNIAVRPDNQGQGIGTALLQYVLREAQAKGFRRVELGTGTFGYQLAFYQRAGFRVVEIVKDHFTENYDKPIFEKGIQLKDMLRLALEL